MSAFSKSVMACLITALTVFTTASQAQDVMTMEAMVKHGAITLVSSTVTPSQGKPGDVVNFMIKLNASNAVNDVALDFELRPAGTQKNVLQGLLVGQSFKQGETKTFSWKITLPKVAQGKYYFAVGAFDKFWRRSYFWNAQVAAISLVNPTPSPTPNPTPSPTPTPTPTPAPTPTPQPTPTTNFRFGVNLSGGEFGIPGGDYGMAYVYPGASDLDYFRSKGLTLVRLPFLWERVQTGLGMALDATEISRLKTVTALAAARGMRLILVPYNFGTYNGNTIGTSAVPTDSFKNFWSMMAKAFAGDPGVYGYDLMAKPSDMNGAWPAIAQAAVNGIRQGDTQKTIFIEGDCAASASQWATCNSGLMINDPYNNYVFTAIVYFDADESGTYSLPYDQSGAYPMIGVDRAQGFIDWIRSRNIRGYISEYGVPNDDARWNVVLDNFLKKLSDNCVLGTYWSAGPLWGSYPLSIQPVNGQDQPQMSVVGQYLGNPACTAF